MATTSGTSGSIVQTAVTKISHADFQTTSGNATQTVSILAPSSKDTTRFLIKGVTAYVTEAWTATAPTITVGDDGDADGYVVSTSGTTIGTTSHSSGAFLITPDITVTTTGANTGTGGAGLSLIPAAVTGAVADSDAAAGDADAQLYVVPGNDSMSGYFETTSAGNATVYAAVGSGGPVYTLNDSDAPGGSLVFFDEDATNTDERFLSTTASGKDIFVPCSDGSFIRVVYSAAPGTPGVQVYADDDSSNNYERLLFVSPTDTAGAFTVDKSVGSLNSSGLVMNDLLALKQDIATIEAALDGTALGHAHNQSFTSGDGVKASVLLGSGDWSSKVAGEFTIVTEFIDLSAL